MCGIPFIGIQVTIRFINYLNNINMKFDFKVSDSVVKAEKVEKERIALISAKVVDWDNVTTDGKNRYPIYESSKNIKGLNVFYNKSDIKGVFKYTIPEGSKIMSNNTYSGICNEYRPYRPKLTVYGVIENNEFVIHSISHIESNLIEHGF